MILYTKKIRFTLFKIHRTNRAQTLPNTKAKFNKTSQTYINSKRQPKLIKKSKNQKKTKNNKPKLLRSQPTRLSLSKKLLMLSNQVLVWLRANSNSSPNRREKDNKLLSLKRKNSNNFRLRKKKKRPKKRPILSRGDCNLPGISFLSSIKVLTSNLLTHKNLTSWFMTWSHRTDSQICILVPSGLSRQTTWSLLSLCSETK